MDAVSNFEQNKKEDARVPLTKKEMHKREFESREELDDEEAETLLESIRAKL